MDNQKKCLYEKFGGDQQVSELIDQFYYKVLFDKLLRDKFLKADMSRVRYQQKRFFSQMMGDKNTQYTGRDLIEVHKNLNISNQQFDKFKTHLKNIAQDMEVPIQDIDELLQHVENHRDVIVFQK
ncbi:unnamed protein product (macronuclear) [Paramecium tetraurelia]|uniref:Group 1 truncated hemoglobin n=1 Tax=Paramecium tetraurelia TaxID=5888 RepID=A0D4J2_PARTE|nr:uncharacterized protein GSPATT00013425001 [Paramecium tetraurelia]CAK77959.1 unnamed protein product [Paramecium tetraurelia]|eukprot:XP_001445356.1 hypothetical protein (macronuclear) [Paramecium tetraurelia strain d4-2]